MPRLGVDSSNESLRRDSEDGQPGYAGMAWGQDPDGQLVIWAPGHGRQPWHAGSRLAAVSEHVPRPAHAHATVGQAGGRQVSHRHPLCQSEPPEQYPAMLRIGSCDIDIPAGTAHHVVTTITSCRSMWTCTRSFRTPTRCAGNCSVVAERPDGSRRTADFDRALRRELARLLPLSAARSGCRAEHGW